MNDGARCHYCRQVPCNCEPDFVAERDAHRETAKEIDGLGKALRTIADWPFNIQNDCVDDARSVARRALFGPIQAHAIDCSYRQCDGRRECNCPQRTKP